MDWVPLKKLMEFFGSVDSTGNIRIKSFSRILNWFWWKEEWAILSKYDFTGRNDQ